MVDVKTKSKKKTSYARLKLETESLNTILGHMIITIEEESLDLLLEVEMVLAFLVFCQPPVMNFLQNEMPWIRKMKEVCWILCLYLQHWI